RETGVGTRKPPGRPSKFGPGRITATVRFSPARDPEPKREAIDHGRSVSEQVEYLVERAYIIEMTLAAMRTDITTLERQVFPPQPRAVAFTARRYLDSERPPRCAQAGQLRTLERRRKEMSSGIYRRGKSSWRIRVKVPGGGKRRRIEQTVRGTRRDAEREKAKLVTSIHEGTLVEPSRTALVEYLRSWLDGAHGLAGKTRERYRQLAEMQIIPHLGTLPLQKLRPAHVDEWHKKLLAAGGRNNRPLSARTVSHCHFVLHRALERAVEIELLTRNVAHAISSPKVEAVEIETFKADEIALVLAAPSTAIRSTPMG